MLAVGQARAGSAVGQLLVRAEAAAVRLGEERASARIWSSGRPLGSELPRAAREAGWRLLRMPHGGSARAQRAHSSVPPEELKTEIQTLANRCSQRHYSRSLEAEAPQVCGSTRGCRAQSVCPAAAPQPSQGRRPRRLRRRGERSDVRLTQRQPRKGSHAHGT